MFLIGENINIMNTKLREAMKAKNKGPIQKIAAESEENGVDYLDLNIGPARKDGPALMEWTIKTVREVSSLPLSLDTTNPEAMKAGLEMEGERAIINSIQAKQDRMDTFLPLMQQYKCSCIALLVGQEGMPRDENERGALAAEFSAKVDDSGIDPGKVYFDPIVLPVRFQQEQVVSLIEFMKMFKDLFPGFRTTCGLSNVSNGVQESLRPLINRTYLVMLEKYGMESAIADSFDKQLISFFKGGKESIKHLIWKSMDENIDASGLSEEELGYLKTVHILMGKSIFSESWLKL